MSQNWNKDSLKTNTMPHTYTEDQLVEQPAIGLFAELGWQTASAMEEVFGITEPSPQPSSSGRGSTANWLGRETKSEVVLGSRLRSALERLNPSIPAEAITAAIDELTRDRSAMGLPAANREVYGLLKDGIVVSFAGQEAPPSPRGRGSDENEGYSREHGGQKAERLRVIDWESPQNNDFLLVSQLTVVGALYTCRPDLVGFVNGLPLVVIEFKKPGVPAKHAFEDNLTHYQEQIPALFWYNAFLIASNGTDSRVGSLTADWERFFEWKRIEREEEPRRVSLEVMIRGTCEKSRLLDLVENFTLFSTHKEGLVKIIGQNHQFIGVNSAIRSMLEARKLGHGRGGVFWQTQGSGKSFSMVFFAQKVLRKLAGNWTFVIVTDRTELDEQIAKTFKAVGAVSQEEGDDCHASSGAHLKELLRGNHRYVFTLIHKFQETDVLCDRRDVIVLTDEAHRSQYDTLALNMRSALPKAMFLAFTGTPLIASEERTREVFGDYVSIYDFQQSVEDGATVPLFYENRTPELHLENPSLNEDIYRILDEAELNEDGERKLQRELGRKYHIITRDDRLEKVAKDIVRHFLGRGFQGKAMVVAIDKATALRMHDKVRKYWSLELKQVKDELQSPHMYYSGPADPLRKQEQIERLRVLETSDMAVVVSPGQNEIEQMKQLGLDIVPHRQRMIAEDLDERFKDPADPLRLVFVCAMWLTGFDAPNCSTVYLDKPMRNHTLMQTIARANRVYPGKHSGLIVDYSNVFESLEKALAIYGAGGGGDTPVRSKAELVDELRIALEGAELFCRQHSVDLRVLAEADGMERLNYLSEAVEALISPDPLRKSFLSHEKLVMTLYKAVKPDPAIIPYVSRCGALAVIANTIRSRMGETSQSDISPVIEQVNELLDASITADSFQITESAKGNRLLNLAKIDFQALSERFPKSPRKNVEIEQLKAAVQATLDRMIRLNPTRIDYLRKFETLIESYNAGSRNIDELFEALVNLSRSLTDEQQRHVRENFNEDELALFDILTRPDPALSDEEKKQVKLVVRHLYQRLQSVTVIDWKKRSSARAGVQEAIGETLDEGLPDAYTRQIYQTKCRLVFDYLYERQTA